MSSSSSINRLPTYVALIAMALVFALPLLVIIMTSLKSAAEIRSGSILALPLSPNLDAWWRAWTAACSGTDCSGMQTGFINSIKIAIPSACLAVLIGAINGFALVNGRIRRASWVVIAIVIVVFIPYQVILYPLVKLLSLVGLFETMPGIILLHALFGVPICTLLFHSFYASLPTEIVRAARMDGAGFWRIFFEIKLPMSMNMVVVTLILQLTGIWNDYLVGLIFAGRENWPMTVQLQNIITTGTGTVEYNVSMAATLITALPPLILYFFSGRYFVRGITAGAVKG